MKKVSKVMIKSSSLIATLALSVGISSVTSACWCWFNQPKMPKDIEKFRKNI